MQDFGNFDLRSEIVKDEPDIEKVKAILEAKMVSPKAIDEVGMPYTEYAIICGHRDIAKLCAEYFDANLQDVQGATALMYAVRFDDVELVKLLVDRGADVQMQDNLGFTAGYFAESQEVLDILSGTIEKGEEPEATPKTND